MSDKKQQEITSEEGFWVNVMRLNRAIKTKGINKTWELRRLTIRFRWDRKSNLWGRFGGGWNWKLGFQAGGRCIIFSLVIFEITFLVTGKDRRMG